MRCDQRPISAGKSRRRGAPFAPLRVRRLGPALLALAFIPAALAIERFPPPDFESGYTFPEVQWFPPRSAWLDAVDVGLLVVALAAAVYGMLVRRSRRFLFWLTVLCLAYFGFWRKGCVCPVGSIQNVLLALSDPSYRIALVIVMFFLLPVFVAFWAGRAFCAGVCPLGGIQDVVLLRPVRVPPTIEAVLRFGPWLYLAAAVFAVLARSDFLICRYDPFVALFRRSGELPMLALGVGLVGLSVFIGRPYCRFLCPYGALLGLCSRTAARPLRITPDECIACGLCHDACPFGAIRPPSAPERRGRRSSPLWTAVVWMAPVAGATAGFFIGPLLASANSAHVAPQWAGVLAGTILGVAAAGRLAAALRPVTRTEYEAVPADCVGCGRCFITCPREHVRRGRMPAPDTGIRAENTP